MRIKLYVEGGGDTRDLKSACRRGFARFVEKAGLKGRMPRIVPCGGRRSAYDDFKLAIESGDSIPMLLVDAEEPVAASRPWDHLRRRPGDQWERPSGAHDDHCHLMVQIMESWFLADKPGLAAFYGSGFRTHRLPQNPNVEQIGKADVLTGLSRATRDTKKKYSKGAHSFKILGEIDPIVVEKAAPSAKRLLKTLRAGGPAPG